MMSGMLKMCGWLGFAVLFCHSAAISKEIEWEKIREKNGVITYSKKNEESNILTIRGETTIQASPQLIFSIMQDNDKISEWAPRVAEKRDIKRVSETERIEYTHVDFPWPLSDRYYINRGEVKFFENGVIKAYVETTNKDFDIEPYVESDKVLGELRLSEFILTPVDGGKATHILATIGTDPKGMIPKWIVNYAQKNWPRDFFQGLKKQLTKQGMMTALK